MMPAGVVYQVPLMFPQLYQKQPSGPAGLSQESGEREREGGGAVGEGGSKPCWYILQRLSLGGQVPLCQKKNPVSISIAI